MKSFLTWLSENQALGCRSCRDVASRLKRVSKFIDIDSTLPDDELLFRLGATAEFKKLTSPVKSQLKRAVKLYRTHKEIKS
jgi:hypothetical protein